MTLVVYTVIILTIIALPLVVAAAFRRRFVLPWWLFLLGMATFVGSQIYHIPLNEWLGDLGILRPVSADDPLLWRTALILGLSAGGSETIARVLGYLVMFRVRPIRQKSDAFFVGLGHGGIEAMLLGGVLTAAQISSLWALRGVDLATVGIPLADRPFIESQLAGLDQLSLLQVAPLFERGMAVTLHIFLSLLVWLALTKRQYWLIGVAVLYHAAFDGTAVYLIAQTENIWLVELVLFLGILPTLFLLWRQWPREEKRPFSSPAPRLFWVQLRKELIQQWRTKRVLIVLVVFLLFGLGSPLLANFTPELVRSLEGAEQFADLIPTPTNRESLEQYISNITQFGFIIAVLLTMGLVAGEKERGTAEMVLSKPLSRSYFVIAKFVAQALIFAVAFLLAALGAHYYTLLLFEPFALGPFLLGNLILLTWLLLFTAVSLLGSSIASSTGAAAGIGLAGSIVLLFSGSLPRIGPLMPSGLIAWASQLGVTDSVPPNAGAWALTVVLIIVCLLTAVAVLERQEI